VAGGQRCVDSCRKWFRTLFLFLGICENFRRKSRAWIWCFLLGGALTSSVENFSSVFDEASFRSLCHLLREDGNCGGPSGPFEFFSTWLLFGGISDERSFHDPGDVGISWADSSFDFMLELIPPFIQSRKKIPDLFRCSFSFSGIPWYVSHEFF